MRGFARCHVGVVIMCRLLLDVCGYCLAARGLCCPEAFVIDVFFHAAWRAWACVFVSLGSLQCSWYVGSASDAFRVDSVVSRLVVGRVLSSLCNLA